MCAPLHPVPPSSFMKVCHMFHVWDSGPSSPESPSFPHRNSGFQKVGGGGLSRVSSLLYLQTGSPAFFANHNVSHNVPFPKFKTKQTKQTNKQRTTIREGKRGRSCLHFFNEISQPLSIAFTGLRKSSIYTTHTFHTTHTSKNRFLARDSLLQCGSSVLSTWRG